MKLTKVNGEHEYNTGTYLQLFENGDIAYFKLLKFIQQQKTHFVNKFVCVPKVLKETNIRHLLYAIVRWKKIVAEINERW